MPREKKLPKQIDALIKEEYKGFLRCDLSFDLTYRRTYIVITKTSLLLITERSASDVKTFAGFAKAGDTETFNSPLDVTAFELGDITSLECEPLVSGGYVYAKTKDEDIRLTCYTAGLSGDVRRFCGDFEKLKKGENVAEKEEKEDIYCPECGGIYPDKNRKICPKCMNRKSLFLRILKYFKPFIPQIIIIMLMFLATAVLNLIYPYLNGTVLYDRVLGGKTDSIMNIPITIGVVVLTMVVSKVLMQIVSFIHSLLTAKIVPQVVKNIRADIFASMGKLSISFYTSRQTGTLMTRVLDDTNQVLSFFVDGLPYFLTSVFTIVATVIVMFRISPQLALFSIILLPILPILSTKMMPRLWHLYGKRHRAARSLNSQINDNITGARVVKAFGQEESEEERFSVYNKRTRAAELNIVSYDNRFHALYSIVQQLATFAVWGFGSTLVLGGKGIELGVLITFASYVTQLNGPLEFMSRVFRWWADSMNCAQRIFEIIDAVPDVTEPENPVPVKRINGDIELKNVTFGYEPHRDVLKNINLHVKPGEILGIVGHSGAGKSTLVNLINRLYDTGEGNIFVDGTNIRDMAFSDFRGSVAMVSQETYIFMGTVAQNIAYARENVSMNEIIAAAKAAAAHDFICKMPDGYDTVIGSSGRSLSGGERQRISIARAVLADPKILILDEATASVDTETEMEIQNSLDKLVKGRTTISIAHRLSTLRGADRLLVIDEGEIKEEGTHKELIEQRGIYYRLMQLQSKALAMRGIEF